MEDNSVNSAEDCVKSSVLDDKCPNLEHVEKASNFIKETSLEKMLEIAEIARMKKLTEPPKWVIPDEI